MNLSLTRPLGAKAHLYSQTKAEAVIGERHAQNQIVALLLVIPVIFELIMLKIPKADTVVD